MVSVDLVLTSGGCVTSHELYVIIIFFLLMYIYAMILYINKTEEVIRLKEYIEELKRKHRSGKRKKK